ncbi:MAG: S24/S26 family peptidase [Chloroflexota bacterium]
MSAASRDHHLQAVDLLLGEPIDGIVRLRVQSGSMRPVLQPGDVVLVRPTAAEEAKTGDVLVLRDAGGFLTHRLIGKRAGVLYTKGDAARWVDPPGAPGSVFGRVVAVERNGQVCADFTQAGWKRLSVRLARLSALEGRLLARLIKPGTPVGTLQKCMARAITLTLHGVARLLQSGSRPLS